MKINCISIDYESNGQMALSDYFSALSPYHLSASCTDANEALHTLSSHENIDVILMNMEMPGLANFSLFKELKSKVKKIILISTNERHAIDAFELEANAFLLKPFSGPKLTATLDKLFLQEPSPKQRLLTEDEFFFIKSKNEKFNLIKIKPKEIIYVESLQNYIAIQTVDKKVVAHLTLTKIKEILKDQDHIIQVHRSFLISKKYIEEIESNVVKMHGNINIAVGGDYRNELLSYIKPKTIQTGRK
ncbi:MAG: LytTR family DNA-binding domain-containing protein [Pedobacter sp.]|nr:LytTR family DNA-binding domain-containing protein [Pedobacter sp.]MDQ8051428.1 LytTR family DNA-binding domain-containing protein [Pedobacter sp.]